MNWQSMQTGIEKLQPVREELKVFVKETLPQLKEKLRAAGAPLVEEL
jgi:hypothetical protein